jgi:hypothetical protein
MTMKPEAIVNLIEEMIDLKVQRQLAMTTKLNPELTRILLEKRESDQRRIQQIKAELVKLAGAVGAVGAELPAQHQ